MPKNEESASGWDRVFNQITSPWDWAAVLAGAGAGAVATTVLHGVDLGHSIPTGALAVVSARRAAIASFRSRALRKRAVAFIKILRRDGYVNLADELSTEEEKWQAKITSSDLFERKIEEVSEEHSRLSRDKLRRPGERDGPKASGAGLS